MKNTATQRLVLGLITLVLIFYVGLQIYRYTSTQYKTEIVYTYTVAESAHVTGVALRREIVLDDRVDSGVATYIHSDGTKVSTGSPIAEVYPNAADAANVQRLRELENRRALLEKAQDPGATSYAHTDVLNKRIFGELSDVIGAVNENDLSRLGTTSDKLLVLMNTKQIATGKQDNYNAAIESLKAEEAYCREKTSTQTKTIRSPQAGYFMRDIDGLEGKVDLDALDELTPDNVFSLINSPAPKKASKRVGKLMTDHNWYFAATVPAEELSKYRVGGSVTLDFSISGVAPVPAVIRYLNTEKDRADSVVVFRCDYVSDALINLRVSQADVKFKSINGLRVSTDAVRFRELEQGVYVTLGENLVFRPVDIVYTDPGFVLCRETQSVDATYKNSLQQYDEVVVGGVGLHESDRIK